MICRFTIKGVLDTLLNQGLSCCNPRIGDSRINKVEDFRLLLNDRESRPKRYKLVSQRLNYLNFSATEVPKVSILALPKISITVTSAFTVFANQLRNSTATRESTP
jgi:hypothetical protein